MERHGALRKMKTEALFCKKIIQDYERFDYKRSSTLSQGEWTSSAKEERKVTETWFSQSLCFRKITAGHIVW